jgi:hypothetical protein
MTAFQVRALAALLLAAEAMPADERDPQFAPKWHYPPDAERWHQQFLKATTRLRDVAALLRSGALARH